MKVFSNSTLTNLVFSFLPLVVALSGGFLLLFFSLCFILKLSLNLSISFEDFIFCHSFFKCFFKCFTWLQVDSLMPVPVLRVRECPSAESASPSHVVYYLPFDRRIVGISYISQFFLDLQLSNNVIFQELFYRREFLEGCKSFALDSNKLGFVASRFLRLLSI